MDSNELLNSVAGLLSDSGNSDKLKELTGMLSKSSDSGPAEDPLGAQMIGTVGKFMESFNKRDNRIDLLNAMRPYIRSQRAGNLDMAIRIIRLLNIAGDFNLRGANNVSDLSK